ncbi:MAG: zinc ribbon domain-containing protein [Kiritimatiellae bacterium]|nr:zinc ribbon domain-containing protein [Kiritimatiellia bacterium]
MKNTVEAPAPLPNETDVAIHAKRYLRQNGYIVIPYKRLFMMAARSLRVAWWWIFSLVLKVKGKILSHANEQRQKKIERAKTNLEESIRSEKILQEQLKALEEVAQKEKEKESVEEVSSEQTEPKSDLSAEQTESKPDLSAKIQELSLKETQDLSKVVTDDAPSSGNKRCKSCQTELPLNARFCRKCGAKVA